MGSTPFVFGDTWTWNDTAWMLRSVSGPPARENGAMGAFQGKVVLFGGDDGTNVLEDMWTWDGAVWTQVEVSGPNARTAASLVPFQGKLYLLGGYNSVVGQAGSGELLDIWSWDGAGWNDISAPDGGAPDGGPVAHGVPGGDEFVVCGEEIVRFLEISSQTSTWNGGVSPWTTVSTGTPSPRDFATMASLGTSIVLFGGSPLGAAAPPDGGVALPLSDTWTWSGVTWGWNQVSSPSSTPVPAQRFAAASFTMGDRVVLFGGYNGTINLEDTWAWNGSAWTQLIVTGPPARAAAAVATLTK
jgi:hypothetical protein